MNIAMQWNHYLQVVGEPGIRNEPYPSLTEAEKAVERLRLQGVRVSAIFSRPKQVLTMTAGGQA